MTLIPEAMSSSVKGGHLKTVVPTVPDAPIGHFRLTLFGGKQGYLTNTRGLCSAPAVTTVEYSAQNGKTTTQKVAAKTACGAKARSEAKAPPLDVGLQDVGEVKQRQDPPTHRR